MSDDAEMAAVVERVALALYAVEWDGFQDNDHCRLWAQESPSAREYWFRSARAAIAAYKDKPT